MKDPNKRWHGAFYFAIRSGLENPDAEDFAQCYIIKLLRGCKQTYSQCLVDWKRETYGDLRSPNGMARAEACGKRSISLDSTDLNGNLYSERISELYKNNLIEDYVEDLILLGLSKETASWVIRTQNWFHEMIFQKHKRFKMLDSVSELMKP